MEITRVNADLLTITVNQREFDLLDQAIKDLDDGREVERLENGMDRYTSGGPL